MNKHCLFHLMLLSGTYHINVSTSPFMDDPSPQTITQYLHDLGFDANILRINTEFYHLSQTQDAAFSRWDRRLRRAYFMWHTHGDSRATHKFLEKARVMCNEVLSPAYLTRYNTVLSYFQALASRAGTPVDVGDLGARMQNLLLRMTACLH